MSPTSTEAAIHSITKKNSDSKRPNDGRPQNGESPNKKGKRVVNQNDSLRDSTIENLLNGQDLKELGSGSKKISRQDIKKKLSSSLKEGADSIAFDDDDEFDLDNSDDLNRFINKYESLITSKNESVEKTPGSKTPTSASKKGNQMAAKNDDDIDMLVEEELSRNHSERSDGETETPILDGV